MGFYHTDIRKTQQNWKNQLLASKKSDRNSFFQNKHFGRHGEIFLQNST